MRAVLAVALLSAASSVVFPACAAPAGLWSDTPYYALLDRSAGAFSSTELLGRRTQDLHPAENPIVARHTESADVYSLSQMHAQRRADIAASPAISADGASVRVPRALGAKIKSLFTKGSGKKPAPADGTPTGPSTDDIVNKLKSKVGAEEFGEALKKSYGLVEVRV